MNNLEEQALYAALVELSFLAAKWDFQRQGRTPFRPRYRTLQDFRFKE